MIDNETKIAVYSWEEVETGKTFRVIGTSPDGKTFTPPLRPLLEGREIRIDYWTEND